MSWINESIRRKNSERVSEFHKRTRDEADQVIVMSVDDIKSNYPGMTGIMASVRVREEGYYTCTIDGVKTYFTDKKAS
ncbi:MAG: hypothetical protein DRQ48_11405 [Gammaproteobacteria bacterium]|nr:MAG: hypothetical protein DRQ48_11405 [Gammaproteobacteria bacterium]